MLQLKRFSRSRSLMNNGVPKGIPNRQYLGTLGPSGYIFGLLGCFIKIRNFDESWSQQNSIKIMKHLHNWSPRVIWTSFWGGGVERAWRLELRFQKVLLLILSALPPETGGGFNGYRHMPPTPPKLQTISTYAEIGAHLVTLILSSWGWAWGWVGGAAPTDAQNGGKELGNRR